MTVSAAFLCTSSVFVILSILKGFHVMVIGDYWTRETEKRRAARSAWIFIALAAVCAILGIWVAVF